jgi:DNA-binding transcriptional ArsR family regulator
MVKILPVAKVFKALSDDTRIAILRHVLVEKEIACQELMKRFPLSQPTMSHHFNKLVDAGILNNRKDGVLWFYSLNDKYLQSLGIDIKKIIAHDATY